RAPAMLAGSGHGPGLPDGAAASGFQKKSPAKAGLFRCEAARGPPAPHQKRYCAETPNRLASPSYGPGSVLPPDVMSIFGSFGRRCVKAKSIDSASLACQVAPIE